MTDQALELHNRQLIEANGFLWDALSANRSGYLTPGQEQHVRRQRRSLGRIFVVVGIVCIVVAAWQLLGPHTARHEEDRSALLVLGCGVVMLALRLSRIGRSFKSELAAGRVASVDGYVRINHMSSSRSGAPGAFYYVIDRQQFETTQAGAKLIDVQYRYRIYHLPGSNIMVNIEALGRPVAEPTHDKPEIDASEISTIVGQPMRASLQKDGVRAAGLPGMVVTIFDGTSTEVRVIVGYLAGAQDNGRLKFYRDMLARSPGARTVGGLGDDASFSSGQLLVRRGSALLVVIVERSGMEPDSDQLLDIEKRVAAQALRSLK
jgi:hypothetical protein